MKIGYIFKSNDKYSIENQKNLLIKNMCNKILVDDILRDFSEYKRLNNLKTRLRKGDTLVVCRLDFLSSSFKHLPGFIDYLRQQNINFISIEDSINTNSKLGKLTFKLFSSLLSFQQNIKKEKIISGLKNSKLKGRIGGRPLALSEKERNLAVELYLKNEMKVEEICYKMKISKPTLLRYVKQCEFQEN